jgi:hypothetical protein
MDKLNFNNKIIRQLKANYKAFVNNKKSSYLNAVTKTIQELSIAQQNYIQYLSRINTIVFNPTVGLGTDGLQAKDGSVTIIDLSGTTSYTELNDDIKKIQKDLDDFYFVVTTGTTFDYGSRPLTGNLIWGENSEDTGIKKLQPIVFIPFSSSYLMQEYPSFRRAYMILSDDVLDDKKYQTFKTALIGNIINNDSLKTSGELNLETEFDFWWKQIAKPTFKEENDITNEFFNKMERDNLKNFLKYTPTLSKSERIFDFVISQSPSNEQKKLITSLNAQTDNISSQSKWNEKQGSVYISKAKLN